MSRNYAVISKLLAEWESLEPGRLKEDSIWFRYWVLVDGEEIELDFDDESVDYAEVMANLQLALQKVVISRGFGSMVIFPNPPKTTYEANVSQQSLTPLKIGYGEDEEASIAHLKAYVDFLKQLEGSHA